MSVKKGRFGCLINCIDGRTQEPVATWLKAHYSLDFIDTVTEPGPDKVISGDFAGIVEAIRSKVLLSINAHGSSIVAIAGHYDCAANPADEETHIRQIRQSVAIVRAWLLPVKVIGLWINRSWQVEGVA